MHGKSTLQEQQKIKEFALLFLIILKLTLCFGEVLHEGYSVPNDRCSIYDTCDHEKSHRTCSCDDDCSKYGICCRDAPEKETYPLEQIECYSKHIPQAVFVKQSCNTFYTGDPDIIASCENDQQDWSDLMANVLVSSTRTWVTYKNWNCAVCNEENIRDLWFWIIQAHYPMEIGKNRLNHEEVRQNFAFDAELRQWGVHENGRFIECPLQFNQPPLLHGQLRYCAENFTSECPSSWRNETVRQKCHSYYGERKVKFSEAYFKNTHCALCNGLKVADLDCSGRYYFSKLLSIDVAIRVSYDLNTRTNEHTENYINCPIDFRYDPFLKVCRSLTCGLKHPKQFKNYCKTSGSGWPNFHYSICISFIILYAIY